MVRPSSRVTSLAVTGCLLVLLAACGPFGPSTSAPTPAASTGSAPATLTTARSSPTAPTGSTPITVPMPTTQTACPPAGTARAAVLAPLVLGSHQTIVYLFNQGTSPSSSTGEIKRYDASTGQKVIIVNSPKSQIFGAQISADGQWILFTTGVSSAEVALQLVRMDGQGLQTLYCYSTDNFGNSLAWSPDQKTVALRDGNEVDLLDLATGHLEVVLVEPTTFIWAAPVSWLDETHISMTSFVHAYIDGLPPQSLYVLDTAKGAHQQVSDLIKVFDSSGPCLSFDSSIDQAKLFVSTCHVTGGDGPVSNTQQGPSAIISEPALGGPQTAVYSTPALAITAVRVISSTTLLLLIQNFTGDTTHNGLWKMNLDGTGLTRLTTAGTGQTISLNGASQFPWANVSHDGTMYALWVSSNNGPTQTQALLIGSLAGTSPSTFATVSSTVDNVAIVGWTTM
jgi:hypothetical protein